MTAEDDSIGYGMTAFPLFDHFEAAVDLSDEKTRNRLMTVAANMVSATIHQFEKITELDEGLASPAENEGVPFDMDTALGQRLMYEECAKDAERVLARVSRLERDSRCKVPGSDGLRLWHAKTMAMLSVSVQELARGLEEANRGNLIPVAVIRNELRARLHT
jgi:hypothetical protein